MDPGERMIATKKVFCFCFVWSASATLDLLIVAWLQVIWFLAMFVER
jgi:hypothetical protein